MPETPRHNRPSARHGEAQCAARLTICLSGGRTMVFVADSQVSHRRTRRIIGILGKLIAILSVPGNTRPANFEFQSQRGERVRACCTGERLVRGRVTRRAPVVGGEWGVVTFWR